MGGKRNAMHNAKCKQFRGRWPVGETAVARASQHAGKRAGGRRHRQGELAGYRTEACRCRSRGRHGRRECVRGEVCANGVESFRSILKRVRKGTFHKMSPIRLQPYRNELAERHSIPDPDAI